MKSEQTAKNRIFFRILLCVLILSAGVAGMVIMVKMKKPPAEAEFRERPLQVETLVARTEDVPVTIRGFGEIRPLNTVTISPEVAGRMTAVHPRLEAGEVIPKGERLFQIDARNYRAAHDDALAKVAQGENAVARLQKEYAADRQRLTTLERNRNLAKAEFERLRKLYTADRVGTRSNVDKAEQAYNSAADLTDLLARQIEIYPIRIREARASLASAQAMSETARANLDRCEVFALFDARIKAVAAEAGQYVSPGQNLVTLADDSVLEIHVPLDSRDARQWLRFDDRQAEAWFSGLTPVACKVRWTEEPAGHAWDGQLHRVVRFETLTRTLTVAVRVMAAGAVSENGLPPAEGMFCAVEIPGKTLHGVVRLPRWAVSFKNTVYLSVDNRLRTVPVQVARVDGGEAFVSGGIRPGDQVITTRLADPLENALLRIIRSETEEHSS
ncbi:efflux RND transporter periplasmic adaptor subun it [Desulfonema ishimotonii]|uniref:Efflux RND transporter periplasmic adaptor subun it n=1 Tax=Desulfonema ishimotonii TaxID=45657 RepID=A0A401G411_9BACT|nr:HlyD family efflux transporter periplasmic adaptor subunit [Desulfonema ishimotonii]GBC63977.1 efflux RND transporter periplasmic adaptor subun it [Desulfonema ishimotonii]